MAKAQPAFRSLKRKLLPPCLLLMAAMTTASLCVFYLDTQRQLTNSLYERGHLIASMTRYAAEGVNRADELQRIVSALGSDHDVLEIVVAGGEPARVWASTRPAWRGKLLQELPEDEVASDLRGALRTRSSSTHFNMRQNLYDFTAPIVAADGEAIAGYGAVMVHLDTQPMRAAVETQALKLFALLLLKLILFGSFVYALLNRVVLRPISAIGERLARHRLGVSDALDKESPIGDEIGELAHTLSSALTQADSAVRELADQKAALDEHSIVAVTDARGRITYVNDKFCKLSQYSREELIGQDHRIINSKHHPKAYIADLWHTLKAGKVWHGELRNRAKDGSFYWVDSTLVPLLGADGRPAQFIAIRTDITEHKRAEEALIKAKAAAESASAAKSEFLANMSHEIRTPMNAVIGLTSLLLDTPLEAKQRELLTTVHRSGDALLGIINDVLDYSKIEAGMLKLEHHTFDVQEMVEEVIDLVAAQAAEKNLELVYEIDDSVPDWLIGDGLRARQVLLNLVSNAIKFTDRGEVLVSVKCSEPAVDQQLVTFSVRDTGIGIPADKIEQLFQSFVQVDSSTTRRVGGTGLGLAISLRLADMMGGRLWVESVHQQGSTFFFSCPFHVSSISTLQDRHIVPASLPLQRVLLVDNNATSRGALQRQLQSWGAQVMVASSGADALRAIDVDGSFTMMLIDHKVSELGGRPVIELLRQRLGDRMPVVILLGTPLVPADGDENHPVWLSKPVKPRALLQALAQALGEAAPVHAPTNSVPATDTTPLAQRYPLRILLAEDNPVNQRVATLMLERIGYQVDLVSTGIQALNAATAREYDLILMDVHMPEMDGLEAARSIRRHSQPGGHRPWIVALTASAMDTERSATREAGMDDFVSKPMRPADLDSMVLRLVAARQACALDAAAESPNVPQEMPVGELNPAVHFHQLIENVSGCHATADMVVSTFLLHVESQLRALQDAIQSGDSQQISRAAHLHKGSLGVISALNAHAVAHQIEIAGRSGDVARARSLFGALSGMMVEVVTALSNWHVSQNAAPPTAPITPASSRSLTKAAGQPADRTHDSC